MTKLLVWHQQFLKVHGANVAWQVYEDAIVIRFGQVYDDPMGELKNLKQSGPVQGYQEQFEAILNQVHITEAQAISMYIGGLYNDIGLPVRMFKPRSLTDTYSLARLQESILALLRQGIHQFFLLLDYLLVMLINPHLTLLKQHP